MTGFMGSALSPADMVCVLGVGGYERDASSALARAASYSSRGMTTWRGEVPAGAGRVKPELLAPSHRLLSSGGGGAQCTRMSGTSVASPVVAGAVALLASALPPDGVANPAFLKQLLLGSSTRLTDGSHMFEQGSGRLNLIGAFTLLQKARAMPPRATLFPDMVDMTDGGCPYNWPYCAQPLYAGMVHPVQLNVTILNAMGVLGHVVDGGPRLVEERVDGAATPPGRRPVLRIEFSHSGEVWPYHGWMALSIRVDADAAAAAGLPASAPLTVDAAVAVTVSTMPSLVAAPTRTGHQRRVAGAAARRSTAILRLRATVVATPPRARRIIWDQVHSLQYPPGYVPRDDLRVDDDLLDWHGDHLWTNFYMVHRALRNAGYFVEILGRRWGPATLSARDFGTLLLVDPERDIGPHERGHLWAEVSRGLSVVVFADWYDKATMDRIRFFDENTKASWAPLTGGANVPAINALLSPYNISLDTSRVLAGSYRLAGAPSLRARFASGAGIAAFPARGGRVAYAAQLSYTRADGAAPRAAGLVPVLGLYNSNAAVTSASGKTPGADGGGGGGRIVLYGDSNCVDASHLDGPFCSWLLDAAMAFASRGEVVQELRPALKPWAPP